MENITTFFSKSITIPFILAVDVDGYVVVDDNVLVVRFGLLAHSILVEKKMIGLNGIIEGTMF